MNSSVGRTDNILFHSAFTMLRVYNPSTGSLDVHHVHSVQKMEKSSTF